MPGFPAADPVFATAFDEPATPAPIERTERFEFTASGSEYFRIWIVNLFLTILTLGIYSAWAKVRKLRYFYDNTRLAGSSFEYHGDPLAILKGRLIAIGALGLYNLVAYFNPLVALPLLLLLIAAGPWIAWKSLQFKLHNSSYRGIRFGFRGNLKEAYKVFLWLPLLTPFTMYFLVPYVHQRIKKFQHEESRFGTTHFSFHADAGKFYIPYGILFLLTFAGGMVFAVFAVIGTIGGAAMGSKAMAGVLVGLGALIYVVWTVLMYPIFLTMIQKLIWNHTKLGTHQFHSDMQWRRMTYIMVTNVLGIVLTLGLFIPFAKVRSMRYRIETMSLTSTESLDDFIADAQTHISATGEGMVDMMDFDLSL